MPNHYKTLEILPNATLAEIKKAHRRLALLYHPDSTGRANLDKSFHSIQEAYEVLSDPKRRAKYDAENGFTNWTKEKVEAYKRNQEQADNRERQAEEQYRMVKTRRVLRKQTSYNQQFFQEARSGKRTTRKTILERSASVRNSPSVIDRIKTQIQTVFKSKRDKDLENAQHFLQVSIDALESLTSLVREVSIPDTTPPRILRMRIPAGIVPGTVLKVKSSDPLTKKAEVIRIAVMITPHPYIEREGYDIIVKLPLTISEAMAGVEAEVPTLDGAVKIHIPPGLVEPKKLRLKDRGVQDKDGKMTGHLYVRPYVVLPEQIDSNAVEAARFIDRLYVGSVRSGMPKTLNNK